MVPKLYQTLEDCCGCQACANACSQNAISFKADEYGFYYPIINEQRCVGCNICVKTCDFQKKEVVGHTPLKGVAARHNDPLVYGSSTSGGVFTAVAQYVLDRKGVVYGCVLDDDMVPRQVAAESMEKVVAMRGSKYVQSDTGLVYREVKENLKAGRWVLFTGTPCQVAALYSYLGNIDTTKLLTVDIICHGVPSPGVFSKYIYFLSRKNGRKVKDFKFRDKRFEWERPVIKVSFEKGKDKWWFTTTDVYYDNFIKGNMHRTSCFQCKYACGERYGDITLGDFWGYQKANLKMSVAEGVSCCLLNTEKAKSLLEGIPVNAEYVDVDIIVQGNTHLRKTSKKGALWESVMNEIRDNGFDNLYSQFKKTHRRAYMKAFIKGLILKPRKY